MSPGFALEASNPAWLVSALAAPWAALLLLATNTGRRHALTLLPLAALPALATALLAPPASALPLPALFYGTGFRLDDTARAFLLPAALLWCLAGWFAAAAGPMRRGSAFAGFWLLALSGNLTLILAAELLMFYAGFALMSFAAYGLVVHEGSPKALNAGRWYLAMMLAGELCLFTAVALMTTSAGPQALALGATSVSSAQPLLWPLLAGAFFIKLGLFGLHGWLPRAHPVAPVAASAVLSGVMIKTGILGWWRLSSPNLPLLTEWGAWLAALGLVTVFYGILAGLKAREPKTILAWSSVSQMGLMALLAGFAFSAPHNAALAWAGIAWMVLHHGLTKGALFLGTGLYLSSAARGRIWIGLLMSLPALSLAGAPMTSGWIAKSLLERASTDITHGIWLPLMLMAGTVGSTVLMARFLHALWLQPADEARTSWAPWLPWASLLLCVVVLPWTAGIPEQATDRLSYNPWRLLTDLWPLALGLTLYLAMSLRGRGHPHWPWRRANNWTLIPRLPLPLVLSFLERHLHQWPTVGGLFTIAAAILMYAAWLGL